MKNQDINYEQIDKYLNENYVPENSSSLLRRCNSSLADCSCFQDIQEFDIEIEESWQEKLFSLIDQKAFKDTDVYKKAFISKQTFSKIRSNTSYHPDRDTAFKLCIGVQADIDEASDLLSRAGYAFSYSSKKDLIIKYFIQNENYDIMELNIVLDKYQIPPLPIPSII